MNGRTLLVLAVLLLPVATVTAADPPPLPWHLADVYLDFDHRGPVESVSVRLQLLDDLPADGHELFLVPMSGTACGRRFYAGVCSQAFEVGHRGGYTAVVRPGYLYTQFATKAVDRALPAKGGYLMTGDHEGNHVSVRAAATAKAGVYTFTLRRRKDPPKGVKDGEVAVDLFVQRDGDREPVAVGGLVFPKGEFTLDQVGGFCEVTQGWDAKRERFRGAKANDPKDIPQFRYVVGDWQVNGKAVTPKSVAVQYLRDVPQRAEVCLAGKCKDKELLGRLDERLRGEDTLVYVVGADDVTRPALEEVTMTFYGSEDKMKAGRQVLKRTAPTPVFTPLPPNARPQAAVPKGPAVPSPLPEPTAAQLRVVRAAVTAAGGEYVELERPWHGLRHAITFPKDAGDDVAKLPVVPYPFALFLNGGGVSDAGLKGLAKQEHLIALSLARTAVTDEGVEELAGFKRLRFLSLAGTKVTGSGLTGLAKLRELAEVDLSESAVSDAGLRELVGAPALAQLNLSGTKITDAGVKHLGGLPALVRLNLHGTAAGDPGVAGRAEAAGRTRPERHPSDRRRSGTRRRVRGAHPLGSERHHDHGRRAEARRRVGGTDDARPALDGGDERRAGPAGRPREARPPVPRPHSGHERRGDATR